MNSFPVPSIMRAFSVKAVATIIPLRPRGSFVEKSLLASKGRNVENKWIFESERATISFFSIHRNELRSLPRRLCNIIRARDSSNYVLRTLEARRKIREKVKFKRREIQNSTRERERERERKRERETKLSASRWWREVPKKWNLLAFESARDPKFYDREKKRGGEKFERIYIYIYICIYI